MITKIEKKMFHGHMPLVILMVKKLLEPFFLKKITKNTQEEFRIEKVIKRKVDKLYDK